MSIKMHSLLSETLPLWFAMISPLVSFVFGFVGAWIFGR
jgi:hypothetical protein